MANIKGTPEQHEMLSQLNSKSIAARKVLDASRETQKEKEAFARNEMKMVCSEQLRWSRGA
jgi:hypothetical protein